MFTKIETVLFSVCAVSLAVSAPLLLPACATQGSSRDAVQFDPMPFAQVGASELEPFVPRSVTDLLRDANEALLAANAAQESGDHQDALRQYKLMLELLMQSDLDPAVFYTLREEFNNILDASSRQALASLPRRTPSVITEGLERPKDYNGLDIPYPLPERVLRELDRIVTGYPDAFQRGLDRSYRYLPYIYEQLEQAGLPRELAWVAMVEGNFVPNALNSRSGAGGTWQFMPGTARQYGLRVDGYVDERFNWQSATRGAIAHLKRLHDFFDGSWPLALSGYNMGEYGLEQRIASNGGERDFWRLIETPPASYRIRAETKNYYPKFIATVMVAGDPRRFGFEINPQPAEDTVRVPVKGPYALEDMDRALGYPRGTLAKLNPDLLGKMTPPTGGDYGVMAPREMQQTLLASLPKLPQMKYGAGTHKVRRGETISGIAARYQVSQNELMRLNGIRSARRLQVNQVLRLPGIAASKGATAPASGASAYIVKRNDTLYDIAKAHRVSIASLQAWNDMGGRTKLKIGRRLRVSDPKRAAAAAPKPSAAAPAASPGYHVVSANEFPAMIAHRNEIKLDDLLAWNNLTRRSKIYVGQKLKLAPPAGRSAPAPASKPAAPAAAAAEKPSPAPLLPTAPPAGVRKIVHTVAGGESVYLIAKKYGVNMNNVLAWNKLTKKSVLQPGDTCVIYLALEDNSTPSAEAKPSAAPARKIVHTVAGGESIYLIAKKYGVPMDDVLAWNKLTKKSVLQPGDKVIIHAD